MSAQSIAPAFTTFQDIDGQPLEGGMIYIGTAGLDAATNQITVYWDYALTIPVTQPIRTVGGYPMNSGSVGKLFTNVANYSLRVNNKNNSLVYENKNAGSESGLSFTSSLSGASSRTVGDKLGDWVSVKDFGVLGDGTDETTAIQAAFDSGAGRLYFPTGTYKFNATLSSRVVIMGNGAGNTIFQPAVTTSAIIEYEDNTQWTYHTVVQNVSFQGTGSKTGVGWSFAGIDPATQSTGDELYNNVTFTNCYFENLEKGFMSPSGNIGCQFYSCGFKENKYGAYFIDSRSAGTMHAGSKYFYAGEISGNDCGVYFWNETDGGGALSFTDTIIESNNIGLFAYNSVADFLPVRLEGVWFEGNGTLRGGSFSVDRWSGTTVTPTSTTNRTIICESARINLRNCFFTDAWVGGNSGKISATDCRVETESGNGGGPVLTDNDTCSVILEDPYTNGAIARGVDNFVAEGRVTNINSTIGSSATRSGNAWYLVPKRSSKITGYGSSLLYADDCSSGTNTGSGTFNLTASVVADGVLYANCTELTRATFLGSEFTSLVGSSQTFTSGKWYCCTFDFKVTAGSPIVNFWDRSASKFFSGFQVPSTDRWYTVGAIGYADAGHTMYLDFSGNGATCTWRISAVQLHEFDSRHDAEGFLASLTYAAS